MKSAVLSPIGSEKRADCNGERFGQGERHIALLAELSLGWEIQRAESIFEAIQAKRSLCELLLSLGM